MNRSSNVLNGANILLAVTNCMASVMFTAAKGNVDFVTSIIFQQNLTTNPLIGVSAYMIIEGCLAIIIKKDYWAKDNLHRKEVLNTINQYLLPILATQDKVFPSVALTTISNNE
ncbi:hypothetical protein HK099_000297 [Clydaea vesicula]|uniref:Uncharacterized protein n=1 Tax=Clydaea vesicula TaxID=447962 RepID=A0AAD5TVH3_9FUNG|nr:hypothetical protein HK099_000297 [Clydaea vesicula]